jgi:NAD(P)-dependent dehydrogenase (short-subunit alcohol dehydrogenase family)
MLLFGEDVDMIDAVVTGAGRGLGRAIARALAADGARVWICSENLPELETTATLIEEAGGGVRIVEADLSDPNACTAFTDRVGQDAGNLQVIVNNAAVWHPTPVLDMSLSRWSETIAVMLTAPFLITRDLLPHLQQNGGSVVSVSSRSAIIPFEGESAYCAAKFGVEALTKCLVLELGECNVSVNTITPGFRIKPTSITEEDLSSVPEAEQAQWQDPMEIMPAFVFLANLRGQVTGHRFNAFELTEALNQHGPEHTMERIREFYRDDRP